MKATQTVLALAALVATGAFAQEGDVSIITGIPTGTEPTSWFLNTDCCEGCLCHGTSIYRLTIDDVRILYGKPLPRTLQAEILDGFLVFDWNARSARRHLFVVRTKPPTSREPDLPPYMVVEGDPVNNGNACTWERLEDYASGEAPFLSWAAIDRFRPRDERAAYCYEVSKISGLLGGT